MAKPVTHLKKMQAFLTVSQDIYIFFLRPGQAIFLLFSETDYLFTLFRARLFFLSKPEAGMFFEK